MLQILKEKWQARKFKVRAARLSAMEPTEVFDHIYKGNKWRNSESVSGGGSTLADTQALRVELPKFFKKYDIKSMLDVPCGDFNWMKHLDLTGIDYIGADIVSDLIQSNINTYQTDRISFQTLDLIYDKVPTVELIFVRDCLVHLSEENIFKAIQNIKASGSKYLLTTTFLNIDQNQDIITGQWRMINLTIAPFNFPDPIELLDELTIPKGENSDKMKVMGLWKIKDLPDIKFPR